MRRSMKKSCQILVGKSHMKRALGRVMLKWELDDVYM